MTERVTINKLAEAVIEGLIDYVDLATDEMKSCVKSAGNTVKDEIKKEAPFKSKRYRNSWTVRKTKESSTTLELTVHSRTRYQLSHLLEHGHAKRGGGRVPGKIHIAPAEKRGEEELIQNIERWLQR